MMVDLKGKKLLFTDGSALAGSAILRAKELGIYTIVANYYDTDKAPAKLVADEAIKIDFSDIDAMAEMIKEKGIDGYFIGWTDSHLPFYVDICEKAGLPCCGTKEQFEILSNDKRLFKKYCEKYGVPVPQNYKLSMDFLPEDLAAIKYPVIVKPADESGSRGIRKCNNEAELIENYTWLYNRSVSKKIFVEQYIDSDKEIFIHYTMQDGNYSLSSAFMKHRAQNENGIAASAILHVFPISCLDVYRKNVEPAVLDMMKGLGLKYGAINFQGSLVGDKFYFYESGMRMGGDQHYVFGRELNGVSTLDLMIEYAVTGKMVGADVTKLDDPDYSKPCVNYYVSLRPGTITGISGIEEVKGMKQVLQCATFKTVGTVIEPSNSLDRVIYRLHVMDDDKEKLAKTLEKISSVLRITDENGIEMQTEHLTYDRALWMLTNS